MPKTLDNSAAELLRFCPAAWEERYYRKITKDKSSPGLDFGTRIHKLLENHFRQLAGMDLIPEIPLDNPELEAEAQMTFARYKSQYPVEEFTVIDVEKFIHVPLIECQICQGSGWILEETVFAAERTFRFDTVPCESCRATGVLWEYTGKMDLVVRLNPPHPGAGKIQIIDHKTEKRGGVDNTPVAWKHKAQVGLYQWAAKEIYQEEVYNIVIDILTRQSPAGKKPPGFTRLETHRTPWQESEAVENLREIARQIDYYTGKYLESEVDSAFHKFPTNRKNCGFCEYNLIHDEYGRDSVILANNYKPAEEYLI